MVNSSRDVDPDELGHAILISAGFDPSHAATGFDVAEALGVPVRRSIPPWVVGEAEVEPLRCGGYGIVLQSGMSCATERFAVCHELAHLEIRRRGIVLAYRDEEDLADRVAASMVLPLPGVIQHTVLRGSDFAGLATKYTSSQTAAALRYAEVTRRPVAVVTPERIRLRGDLFPWPHGPALRKIAAGYRDTDLLSVVQLTDQPDRAVLIAS